MLERSFKKGSVVKETVDYAEKGFSANCFYASSTERGLGFIPHLHEEFEILYILSPSARIFCNNKNYTAERDDIFVFNSGELHSCLVTEAGYQSKCIQFDFKLLASKFIDDCEYKYIRPMFDNVIQFKNYYKSDSYLIQLFKEMDLEFKDKSTGYELAIKGGLYRFLTYLLRNGIRSGHIEQSKYGGVNKERVDYALNYIADNYREKISLELLLNELYVNQSYFCRIFKEYTGKSFIDYLNNYRVLRALGLISSSNKTVTDIASETGFDDINYFSRMFKKYIGISPTETRRQCLKAQTAMGYVDGKIELPN